MAAYIVDIRITTSIYLKAYRVPQGRDILHLGSIQYSKRGRGYNVPPE